MKHTKPALFTVALFVLATSVAARGEPPQEKAEPIPDWVVAHWEGLIGIWTTDNAAYKSDRETMDAYGIEWKWGLGKKSLVGRLYGIRDGAEVGSFWQFREFWHPGEGRLVATQFGSDGTYGAGPQERKDDGTLEMVQTFYDPTTGGVLRVGHRLDVKQNEHVTRSYDVSEDGVSMYRGARAAAPITCRNVATALFKLFSKSTKVSSDHRRFRRVSRVTTSPRASTRASSTRKGFSARRTRPLRSIHSLELRSSRQSRLSSGSRGICYDQKGQCP
jgi:hypothetical protein